MTRRKRIGFPLILTLLTAGLFSGWALRIRHQEQLDRLLMAAIKRDKAEHSPALRVRACLERGADPNAHDEAYRSDLSRNHLMILFGLKRAPVVFTQPALLLAVEGGLKRLEYDGVDAKEDARPHIVKALLQYGADVRVKDKYGRTPLIAAFQPVPKGLIGNGVLWVDPQSPSMECAVALIAAGADVEARDEDGRTPLMLGHNSWQSDAVDTALLRKGVDVNASSEDGMTALICRAQRNDARGCLMLLDHGADINRVAKDGSTALMYAAQNGNRVLVDTLIRRGADINLNVGKGRTALMAVLCGEPDSTRKAEWGAYDAILRTLLQRGAVVDAREEQGLTALIYASSSENTTMAQTLLQHGANVNANAGHGQTALMTAAYDGRIEILRTLLQHGAVVDARDEQGSTALVYAARGGHEACVRLLLKNGASATIKDKAGKTLYESLKEWDGAKNPALMRLLQEHGMRK
ncbi:MAG: hypothetical protein JWN14_333 [Chthonomonadales bacterium]|nr:hypothetical protein [Chthonomonadales bacterium]